MAGLYLFRYCVHIKVKKKIDISSTLSNYNLALNALLPKANMEIKWLKI